MAFNLTDVVPWGRTFAEYTAMFALSGTDLSGRILGCGDGPASFNAEARERGLHVLSTDPVYKFSAPEIETRIDATATVIADQMRANPGEFVWDHFRDVDALVEARMEAMGQFLADYPTGTQEGRYLEASLPNLPFQDRHFDLALCSHFLFLYSQQHGLDFHIAAVTELCRVAREVRIFPLVELGSVPSRHLDDVIEHLRKSGQAVERVAVAYEFQKGANEMLHIAPTT